MSTRRAFLQSALLLPSLLSSSAFAQDNKAVSFADFEGGSWGDWTVEGDAFGASPATDALFPGKIRGFGGNGFVCTLHPKKGNAAIGKAVSRAFTIEKPFITFKIGGGSFPGAACLNLVVEGQVTHTATGNGTATLSDASWDVSALVGKKAHLEIVDASASTERGYVMIDDIQLVDAPDSPLQRALPEFVEAVRRKYEIPAIFVAVGYRGSVYAFYCGGQRRIDVESPVSINDKIMIGSITKAMNQVVTGVNVKNNVVHLEDSVSEVLAELRNGIHPAYANVSIEQLYKHFSGLPSNDGIPYGLKESAQKYRYAFVKAALKTAPVIQPGTKFSYSNAGYEVVAVMNERVTGKPFEVLLSDIIWRPIGMHSAGMGKPYESENKKNLVNQPWGHHRKDGRISPTNIDWNSHMFAMAGSGGVHCSIIDLCKFGNTMSAGLRRLENPLGKEAFNIMSKAMDWTPDWATNGATGLGDYSSISISANSVVVAVHSTLQMQDGGESANNEIIRYVNGHFKKR